MNQTMLRWHVDQDEADCIRSLAIMRELVKADPDDMHFQYELARSYEHLGHAREAKRDYKNAIADFGEAVALARTSYERDSQNLERRQFLGNLLIARASAMSPNEGTSKTNEMYLEAAGHLRAAYEGARDNLSYHQNFMRGLGFAAKVHIEKRAVDTGVAELKNMLELAEDLRDRTPGSIDHQATAINTSKTVAELAFRANQLALAITALSKSIEWSRDIRKWRPNNTNDRQFEASVLAGRASLHVQTDQMQKARADLDAAEQIADELKASGVPQTGLDELDKQLDAVAEEIAHARTQR